jgi:hypothetical protein
MITARDFLRELAKDFPVFPLPRINGDSVFDRKSMGLLWELTWEANFHHLNVAAFDDGRLEFFWEDLEEGDSWEAETTGDFPRKFKTYFWLVCPRHAASSAERTAI